MSNLGSVPQIPVGTTIALVSGASWLDQFYVQAPGYPAQPIQVLGTLNLTTSVPVSSNPGIATGMLVQGYGIPFGTFVTAVNTVAGATTLTLSQAATINSGAIVPLSIFGPPLDLTGIDFSSYVRESLQSQTILLNASTTNGLMINGGVNGTFGWNVPPAQLPNWPIGLVAVGSLNAVVDIQASDNSGQVFDLTTQSGPIPLSVTVGNPPVAGPLGHQMITVAP